VLSSTDNPDRFAPGSVLYSRPERPGVVGSLRDERVPLIVENIRGDDDFPIVAFREVTDRNEAEALRGSVLEVSGDDLPGLDEDEYYPFDLIGLAVKDETGVVRGRVIDTVETPAHALLAIEPVANSSQEPVESNEKRREVLVPFVMEAVPSVCLAEGYLVVSSEVLVDEEY